MRSTGGRCNLSAEDDVTKLRRCGASANEFCMLIGVIIERETPIASARHIGRRTEVPRVILTLARNYEFIKMAVAIPEILIEAAEAGFAAYETYKEGRAAVTQVVDDYNTVSGVVKKARKSTVVTDTPRSNRAKKRRRLESPIKARNLLPAFDRVKSKSKLSNRSTMSRSRRRTTKRRRRTRRVATNSKKSIVKVVRKELAKTTETHVWNRYGDTNGTSGNLVSSTTYAGNAIVWRPGDSISQGKNSAQRTGSEIYHLGFTFKCLFENLSTDHKMGVRLMLLKKKRPNVSAVTNLWENNDAITGHVSGEKEDDDMLGGVASGYHINDMIQLYKPVNKDLFSVLYNKVFFLERKIATETRTSNRLFMHYFKTRKKMTYHASLLENNEVELVAFYHYITSDTVLQAVRPKMIVLEWKEFFLP